LELYVVGFLSHSNRVSYILFSAADQQQNLSQLASLAGTQSASGMQMGQSPVGMNMGMGGLMNDNSGGEINRHGDMQGGMVPF
jgi:hypothetical protein